MDIAGLVTNTCIGADRWVDLTANPLSEDALCERIPALESRGVIFVHDGTWGSAPACTLFETLGAEGEIVAGERGPGLGIGTDYPTWDIEGIEVGSPFGDGVPDLWELAMFADSYSNEERWLHDETVAAYDANLAAVTSDLPERSDFWEWIAASVSLSSRMRDTVCALFGLNSENYEPVTLPGKGVNEPFSAEGDCDGDGISNIEEYEYVVACGGDIESFVIAASVNSPFWNGNPAVPVAGIIGLLLLCAGIAVVHMHARRATGA